MGVHNTCEDGVRLPPTRREETVMMIGEEFVVDCIRVRGKKEGILGGEFRGIQLYLPSVRCLGGADVCDAITAHRITRHRRFGVRYDSTATWERKVHRRLDFLFCFIV